MAHIVKKLPQNKWEKTHIFSYACQLSKTGAFVTSLSLSSRSCRRQLWTGSVSFKKSCSRRKHFLISQTIRCLFDGVLRVSVFHVVKWYLIFPDFLPFLEPFMTKKPVQRRILTVVRPRSLDSVVIEAAGEFGRRLFKPQSFPRIGRGCSDAYRTGMTTQYVSVQCNVCLPYGRPGTWN